MQLLRTLSQRAPRFAALLAAGGLGAGLLTACQPPAATFTVTTNVDAVDANIGDGVCATAAGVCSLRAAVQEGNANPNVGPIEVLLSLEVHTLTIAGASENAAATGDLDLTRPFRFVGTGLPKVSATGDRVFDARPGGHLEVVGVDVTGKPPTPENGGAIRADQANVTVTNSRLSGTANAGGAIFSSAGQVVVTGSAIVKSSATFGAAIHARQFSLVRSSVSTSAASNGFILFGGSPDLANVIESSTITGNTATSGPTVSITGDLTVRDSTVVANDSGYDFVVQGDFAIGNSILAAATPGENCHPFSVVTSLGGNVETGTDCDLTAPTDVQSAPSTGLGVADTTGLTVSFPPVAPPALDGGIGCLALDQTLVARPLDGNASGTIECDRGAREVAAQPLSMTVDTLTDGVDVAPGDGVCATAGGGCTVRAAVMESNVRLTTDQIVLPVSQLASLSIPGAGEDAAATGDLDILDDVTITGNEDVALAVIDGNDLDRVLDVHSGTVTLSNIVLGDGTATNGGGLRTAAGTDVTLVRSMVFVNAATGGGGGIWAGGTLTLDRSILYANNGGPTGGGLLVDAGGVATIVNSTATANTATAGSAVTTAAGTTVTITDSTLAANTGVGIQRGGTVTVRGSIVSGHAAGNCSSALTSLGNNLDSGTTCGFTGTGDAQGTDPQLGALAGNGGPTLTIKPLVTSPAIGTSSCTTATDQRGTPRPQGGACDKGSFEQ